MAKKSFRVLSVGGSIVSPKEGFNIRFLAAFRKLILREVQKGERFILVIGGGAPARQYQEGLRELGERDKTVLDWMGIGATIFNAQFVRLLFGKYAYPHVITKPTEALRTGKPILVAGGNMPGHSTDTDAVLLARTFGVQEIINLSNIDAVYTKDPKKDPTAVPIRRIDWPSFRKSCIPNVWSPGANAPFDPVASRLAEQLNITVTVIKGTNLREVERALQRKGVSGTVIHPL